MTLDLDALKHSVEIFDLLRTGRHLCAEDSPYFLTLRSQFEEYRALYEAVGFELVQHERGIYYFSSNADLGKAASALAVFFFVLVEAWGDEGVDLEAAVFDQVHEISNLPHFTRESWKKCMEEADVHGEGDLSELVQKMERLGFVKRTEPIGFRFRTPAWRLLDLCMESLPVEERAGDVIGPDRDAK